MRSGAIALAVLVAGCNAETALRIEVPDPGVAMPPVALRVTLTGAGIVAPPRIVAPVSFPGVLVVKGLPAGGSVCVEIDGLDISGRSALGGAATVTLASHATTRATVALDGSFTRCDSVAPEDLSAAPPADLAGVDLAEPPPPDGSVAVCPAGVIFCDDFETGDDSKWPMHEVRHDGGTLQVQSATKAHGTFALRALATGSPGAEGYAELIETFTPTAPPFALRANVYFPQTLTHYDHLVSIYENENTMNNFSVGGANDATWVVTENEATVADRHSDMVPTDAGKWHCIELVIDAGGRVTLFVDNHQLIGPWQRASNVSYSRLLVGVTRSVDTDLVAYVDDVAIGPTRLYCPQ